MSTREEIVQQADLLGYRGEKREEYLKQEFKVLAERAAIARKEELEAERAARKEELEAERVAKKEETEKTERERHSETTEKIEYWINRE
ncbi:hypothetical protein ElyMa_006251700 [Elysia marginata]|uniref:Uncharacterized protein n=1 Tax=Elysia marginata TaxID=1093978 RepID=A0AAV4HBT9_9GAST|nr:hypothetical protein ElyMa_006251700 [Elysia marginata]